MWQRVRQVRPDPFSSSSSSWVSAPLFGLHPSPPLSASPALAAMPVAAAVPSSSLLSHVCQSQRQLLALSPKRAGLSTTPSLLSVLLPPHQAATLSLSLSLSPVTFSHALSLSCCRPQQMLCTRPAEVSAYLFSLHDFLLLSLHRQETLLAKIYNPSWFSLLFLAYFLEGMRHDELINSMRCCSTEGIMLRWVRLYIQQDASSYSRNNLFLTTSYSLTN